MPGPPEKSSERGQMQAGRRRTPTQPGLEERYILGLEVGRSGRSHSTGPFDQSRRSQDLVDDPSLPAQPDHRLVQFLDPKPLHGGAPRWQRQATARSGPPGHSAPRIEGESRVVTGVEGERRRAPPGGQPYTVWKFPSRNHHTMTVSPHRRASAAGRKRDRRRRRMRVAARRRQVPLGGSRTHR